MIRQLSDLTGPEMGAYQRYQAAMLDRGASRTDAAHEALTTMLTADRTARFVDWLSGGALLLGKDNKVLRRGVPLDRFGPILGVDDVWGRQVR